MSYFGLCVQFVVTVSVCDYLFIMISFHLNRYMLYPYILTEVRCSWLPNVYCEYHNSSTKAQHIFPLSKICCNLNLNSAQIHLSSVFTFMYYSQKWWGNMYAHFVGMSKMVKIWPNGPHQKFKRPQKRALDHFNHRRRLSVA